MRSLSYIGDPQPHDFGDPQAGGVGRHQRGAMLQARHRREKPHDFVGAQDHRQLLLLARVGDALDHRGAPEGDAVEEAQGRNRDIEAGPRRPSGAEVDLIGSYLRQPQEIW
jgi:hypothetical protein